MTAAEVFRLAMYALRERGWRQGSLGHGDGGPVCALGALNIACGLPPETGSFDLDIIASDETDALVETLIDEGTLTGRPHNDPWLIIAWNDRAGQTVENVLAAFERTAARLEALS